jgi:hypothetical protein
MKRILGSFGIERVYHGSGRVLHQGTGAGVKVKRRNNAELTYRANRKTLAAQLIAITQALRLAGVKGFEKANNPQTTLEAHRQTALVTSLRKLGRLQAKLVALWEEGRIDDSMETVVNAVLVKLNSQARAVVSLLAPSDVLPANPLEVVAVSQEFTLLHCERADDDSKALAVDGEDDTAWQLVKRHCHLLCDMRND